MKHEDDKLKDISNGTYIVNARRTGPGEGYSLAASIEILVCFLQRKLIQH